MITKYILLERLRLKVITENNWHEGASHGSTSGRGAKLRRMGEIRQVIVSKWREEDMISRHGMYWHNMVS